MKKLLFVTAAMLGLAGTAWADAPSMREQAQKNVARLFGVPESWVKTGFSCGPEGCQQSDPKEDINNSPEMQRARRIATARSQAEGEIKLRKMGMLPDVAHKAIWAAQNRFESSCAQYVRQLLSDYGGKADHDGDDGELIISIEHSGICERKNLH